jgi:hypothetical protein
VHRYCSGANEESHSSHRRHQGSGASSLGQIAASLNARSIPAARGGTDPPCRSNGRGSGETPVLYWVPLIRTGVPSHGGRWPWATHERATHSPIEVRKNLIRPFRPRKPIKVSFSGVGGSQRGPTSSAKVRIDSAHPTSLADCSRLSACRGPSPHKYTRGQSYGGKPVAL